MSRYIIVDTEATGPTPYNGKMTEFGAVRFTMNGDLDTFHGVFYDFISDPVVPAIPIIQGGQIESFESVMSRFNEWLGDERVIFVSDNPAFDFQWIADAYARAGMDNRFGFSARRIGDIYAGAVGNLKKASEWKKYRETTHDHNPVNDAIGNAEALRIIITKYDLKGCP